MQLRPYQNDLINKIRKSLTTGNTHVCAVLGCGGGKSIIQGTIAANATAKKNRVLFLVHRKELCEQIAKTFELCGVDFDYCHIGMVQTVTRRLDEEPAPKLIIVDECHHIMANSYLQIVDRFPKALLLGFTATPCRLDSSSLGSVFQDLVQGVTTRWLIDNHYLSDYKYYGIKLVDTSKLHTRHGDFDKREVEELMSKNYIFGSAVDNWLKYAKGQQTIVYCSSIETSKATVEAFKAKGIQAYHLDGKTPQNERESIVEGFRNGSIRLLSNVDLFGEGFDVPDCSCVILLRPTKSLSLHIQQSMRSMRYKEGKTAIILDHVGNYTRHGLPDHIHDWTLDSKRQKEKTTITVRQCPECFSVMPSSAKICPCCGAEMVVQRNGETNAKVIEEVLLEEIAGLKYEDYKKCTTWDELNRFRKAKKFKFPWAIRRARELNISIPEKYNNYIWVNRL